MSNVYLFRLKAIKSPQEDMFHLAVAREEFFKELFSSKPSAELREGYVWHIGNLRAIGDRGLAFAVGRTTKKNKELYDDESGNFMEVEEEESPFTYAYYEQHFGILGILHKSRLSPTVKGIARSLENLLNEQELTKQYGARIEVSEIWDPEGFLQQVLAAYAVIAFTVEFGEPNPFDVDQDFHRPMERYLAETGANKGKTTVQGDDLNRDNVERVTRSVASTGNDATARLRQKEGQRPVTKHLKGDPVTVPLEEGDAEGSEGLLDRILEAYRRIRTRGGE